MSGEFINEVHYFIQTLFVFGVCFQVAEHLCYGKDQLLLFLIMIREIALLDVAHFLC